MINQILTRLGLRRRFYRPHIPSVDQDLLISQVSNYFRISSAQADSYYDEYRVLHNRKDYARVLGERKTLCFEEAFIISVILRLVRPANVVEIGTQYGKSTRRIIDIKNALNLNSQVTCFDIEDQVRFFESQEAQLILKDVTHTFQHDVLETCAPEVIFLDAHPYYLLRNVISGVLDAPKGGCILVIHDCAKGLCNPSMRQSKDDPNVTSTLGVWERHVLAEIFGIANPLSEQLDDIETVTHRLKIFGTPHGLAVIMPKKLLLCEGDSL